MSSKWIKSVLYALHNPWSARTTFGKKGSKLYRPSKTNLLSKHGGEQK